MSAATATAHREEIGGQWSGYWLDPGRQPPTVQPTYRPTGAVLRRIGETNLDDFVCLDLVLVETSDGFAWLPLSEAGRYTYAHSLGLLQSPGDSFFGTTATGVSTRLHTSIRCRQRRWRRSTGRARTGAPVLIVRQCNSACASSAREDLARGVRRDVARER
jgi:hypothetical protein